MIKYYNKLLLAKWKITL